MIASELCSTIASVWYSTKTQVACVIALKTNEPFIECLKVRLIDSSEKFRYKC